MAVVYFWGEMGRSVRYYLSSDHSETFLHTFLMAKSTSPQQSEDTNYLNLLLI